MTGTNKPTEPPARPFHEVHASLLDNLANYERYAGYAAGRSYGRDMAVDVRALLERLMLGATPDRDGTGEARLDKSLAAGQAAFFAVVSTFWPEAVPDYFTSADDFQVEGDTGLLAAMQYAVEAWLISCHPDAQE